ncbi:MobV family relaxase, partial [Limosilactobacillus mucosae]|uniref:MobV family relaxase n=1 Tax=Limosilactobacillus mucosae TaxID=97478 RepID=UPI0039940921
MSFLVATMKKNKAENLNGIFMHDFRRTENHSNKEIDVARSADNYELIDHQRMSKQVIMDYISAKRTSKRAVRKDAVVLNEWIVSSDQEFFKGLDADQIRQYFQTAVDWFGREFGRDNLQYAVIHMDETTPHMHLGIVPINGDGTLSGKKMFNRDALKHVQNDLPKYLADHGFDIQRGIEGQKKKHLTTKEYKAVQAENEAIKHDLATAYVDAAIAYHGKEPRDGRDALLQQLEQESILEIGNWIKKLFKMVQKAIRDLRKREKKLADGLKKLDQREEA